MSAISSISSIASQQVAAARAPDGDSPAVEAAESAATKKAEAQNGGVAPKAVQPSAGTSHTGQLNTTA